MTAAAGSDDAARRRAVLAMRDCAHGLPEGLETLVQLYGGRCYSYAREIVRDPGLAQDVLQEVCLQVWADAGRYDQSRTTPLSWLLMLTHRRAVDCVRREQQHRSRRAPEFAAAGLPSRSGDPQALCAARRSAHTVRLALERLPDGQRQVLLLAYYGDLTQREMAQLLELPLGTLKSRVLLGLRRLRSELFELGLVDADEAFND